MPRITSSGKIISHGKPPSSVPTLQVTPSSLAFGTVTLGTFKDLNLQVKNTKGGTLIGTATASAPFSIVGGASFSLGHNQVQAVSVRFTPTAASSYSSSVTITSNGGNSSPSVTGTGSGLTITGSLSQTLGSIPLSASGTFTYAQPPGGFLGSTGINDSSLVNIPSITQPVAGAWYTDPAFGTRILRMTDATTADSSHVPYAYWPSWNSTETKVWFQVYPVGGIGSNSVKTLWDWNSSGVPSNKRNLQSGGTDLVAEGLIWSRVTADLLYGFSTGDFKLYSLVPASTPIAVVDLGSRITPTFPTAHHFWQMSMGGSDRYFCWTVKDVSGTDLGIALYDKTLDSLVLRSISTFLGTYDEAHLTRDGLFCLVSQNPGTAILWDWINHPTPAYGDKDFNMIVAHEDFGPSTQLAYTDYPPVSSKIGVWDLASWMAGTKTEDQASTFIGDIKHATATTDWPEFHISWQNLNDADPQLVYWSTVLNSDQTAAWRPYFDEIWKVWTNGTGPGPSGSKYRRLAHHRSEVWGTFGGANYRSYPKGNVSPSGRWFAYTSNWRKASIVGGVITRIDVYILKIPTEAEFAAGWYTS